VYSVGGIHTGSTWANPFMMGESSISSVTLFSCSAQG
jgi:hypothetical protein